MKKIVLVVIGPLFYVLECINISGEHRNTRYPHVGKPLIFVESPVPAHVDTPLPDETQHAPVLPLKETLTTGITGFWGFRRI